MRRGIFTDLVNSMIAGLQNPTARARETKVLKRNVNMKVTIWEDEGRKFVTKQGQDEHGETLVQREINILKTLRNQDDEYPSIIRAKATQIRDRQALMLEPMDGNLLLRMRKKERFPMEEKKIVAFHILSALQYLQRRNIVHFDLRRESIMYQMEDNRIHAKLSNFSKAAEGAEVSGRYGNIPHSCPESLENEPYNGFAADIWAFGVLVHFLMTQTFPHCNSRDHNIIINDIRSQNVPNIAEPPSQPLGAFLDLALKRDLNYRASVDDLLNHPWLDGVE